MPSRTAAITASTLDLTSSFRRRFVEWLRTVCGLSPISVAMYATSQPSARITQHLDLSRCQRPARPRLPPSQRRVPVGGSSAASPNRYTTSGPESPTPDTTIGRTFSSLRAPHAHRIIIFVGAGTIPTRA